MLRSSILEKISPTKGGGVISGQHGTTVRSKDIDKKPLLFEKNAYSNLSGYQVGVFRPFFKTTKVLILRNDIKLDWLL